MRDLPHVLIIEKSRFPANVQVEECERLVKTPDNKNAIIRYQRRTDVSVIKQIGRFFSDLFNGVTRARGIVCDKPELPGNLHIRGKLFNITRDAGSSKALMASPPDGQARPQAELPALKIEVHEVPLRKSHPALAYKVAEELRDRFEAVGQSTDRVAVEYFLELDSQPNFEMTPMRVARLMQFSDALGRMSGTLQRELGADVLAHVLDRMQRWQDRIAKVEVQGPAGPAPAYPGFRFKGLSAFAAMTADAASNHAGPAQRAEAPQVMPAPAARPAPVAAEALHQPQAQPLPDIQPLSQVQPPPPAQREYELQPLPEVQPLPDLQPLPQVQPPLQAQIEHEIQPLPEVHPLPDLQPLPQVQPPPQVQRQPEAPPPPPPPPSIKPAVPAAASSAGPDANELASGRSRLKPATTKPVNPEASVKDDSTAGILARAMAQRRVGLKEEESNNQNDNDDEWK